MKSIVCVEAYDFCRACGFCWAALEEIVMGECKFGDTLLTARAIADMQSLPLPEGVSGDLLVIVRGQSPFDVLAKDARKRRLTEYCAARDNGQHRRAHELASGSKGSDANDMWSDFEVSHV